MSGLAERYKPCGATECEYQEVIVPLKSEIERLLLKLDASKSLYKLAGAKVNELESQLDHALSDVEHWKGMTKGRESELDQRIQERNEARSRLDNIIDEIEQLSISIHSPDWLPSEEEERQKSIEESAGRLMKLCVVEGQCPKCGNKNCDGKGNYCVVERQDEAK